MSTPSEIIYARVAADLKIGERLRKLRDSHEGWHRPSLGKLIGELLDKSLPPIVEPKVATKKKGKVRK